MGGFLLERGAASNEPRGSLKRSLYFYLNAYSSTSYRLSKIQIKVLRPSVPRLWRNFKLVWMKKSGRHGKRLAPYQTSFHHPLKHDYHAYHYIIQTTSHTMEWLQCPKTVVNKIFPRMNENKTTMYVYRNVRNRSPTTEATIQWILTSCFK